MRYKIGDKVRIMDYDLIKREYPGILENRETLNEEIEKLKTNRVVTIKDVVFCMGFKGYLFKEIDYGWYDELIDCSLEECKEKYYIKNRFEILDL